MTSSPHYDGTTPLAPHLLTMWGYSLGNTKKGAQLMAQAKQALGITGNAKLLPTKVKLAIFHWHYAQLHPTWPYQPVSAAELNASASVDTISQAKRWGGKSEEPVPHPIQPVPIAAYEINDLVRIAFYTSGKGVRKRQVIAIDGFYVNAVMQATGIAKHDVPKWVQQQVNGWGAFNSALPVTRQVKYLMIRELMRAYG